MTLLGFNAVASFSIGQCKTVAAAVRNATKVLNKGNVPESAASAEYLAIATFSGIASRRSARTSNRSVIPTELDRYRTLVKQRGTQRTPVQYLVGSWDFHNIELNVRPPVLIPRPETEELVEHVLIDDTLSADVPVRILDIGCGSGAILLALLAARPLWTGVGIDLSETSIGLSSENANKLGLSTRVHFAKQRVEEATLQNIGADGPFDVIVSNPPYIPAQQMATLDPEVRLHEDERALCGGKDGLDTVFSVLKASRHMLKSNGHLWLEVDESHPAMFRGNEYFGMVHVSNFNDLFERPRFCQFVKK